MYMCMLTRAVESTLSSRLQELWPIQLHGTTWPATTCTMYMHMYILHSYSTITERMKGTKVLTLGAGLPHNMAVTKMMTYIHAL